MVSLEGFINSQAKDREQCNLRVAKRPGGLLESIEV